MSYTVIIPARYASTRLPGKPLRDIAGKPLIQHVFECAASGKAARVVVATDDERIEKCCRTFGAEVVMTRSDHPSGTDRLAESATLLGLQPDEIVVNLQGDEPMMPACLLDQVAQTLADGRCEMATLGEPISDADTLFDPNVVKFVRNAANEAMYFSRAPIPWQRDQFSSTTPQIIDVKPDTWFRHIGLYAYRVAFLQAYPNLAQCELETLESLEQLRVLYHGYRIQVAVAIADAGIGVDTEADLIKAEALLSK